MGGQFDWQNVMALVFVGLATTYLAIRVGRTALRRRAAGCSAGCSNCPTTANDGMNSKTDVSIEQFAASARQLKSSRPGRSFSRGD